MKGFYITTPIYYVNARPHLGHAYTTIVADCQARFQRALGSDVFFLTGTDEHGDKIVQAAEKAGQDPETYATEISSEFQELWPKLGITNNDFIRTTEERHKRVVQDILAKVYEAGDIYYGEYGGHYCYGCERFLTEKELENGLCPDHKSKPEHIIEKNYFFRMSKYQDWLLDHIEKNPDYIRPERYKNEVVSLLKSGALEDLCISRPKSRLTWGIELPFDRNYVCYVWFDALINYLSAMGYPDGERFNRYWPAQHLVAKDILKPHGIFWPTMLKSAGIEPYEHLNVHGYWLIKETKMSKSLGNVVDPLSMAEVYGLDTFRYFLMREMRFGNDAGFSEEALVARRNADLANDLGNLFSRALTMTHKYFGGQAPEPGPLEESEKALGELAREAMANYVQLFGTFRFARALDSIWELIRGLNKYIDATQPWALHKAKETERLATVIYTVLEYMRKCAVCLWPVMPNACEAMLAQLGQKDEQPSIVAEMEGENLLAPGTPVAKHSNLFPRVDACKQPEKPKAAKKEKAKKKGKAPEAPEAIEFPDFTKVRMLAGKVKAAEKHPDADKLLVLTIDLGEEKPRTIVSGLAAHYDPADLVGRQVIVVANLAPRKLRGVESQGMVLTVQSGKQLMLLSPSGEAEPGSPVS